MSKVIVTIPVQSETASAKDIVNAVRRAFVDGTFEPGQSGTVKGITYRVKPSPEAPVLTLAQEVRKFARANGIEVGTRGRLSADLFAQYAASTK